MPLTGDTRVFEEVAQRPQPKRIPPALPAMLGRIVDHVAALAKRPQVGWIAVARIVIEVRARQHDICHPYAREREAAFHRDALALVRSPAPSIGVPPASIAEMRNLPKVRPTALLAAPTGTLKPDRGGQLLPVNRVEPAIFCTDRHHIFMSHPTALGKQKSAVCY